VQVLEMPISESMEQMESNRCFGIQIGPMKGKERILEKSTIGT
jgi:hypothetical protein